MANAAASEEKQGVPDPSSTDSGRMPSCNGNWQRIEGPFGGRTVDSVSPLSEAAQKDQSQETSLGAEQPWGYPDKEIETLSFLNESAFGKKKKNVALLVVAPKTEHILHTGTKMALGPVEDDVPAAIVARRDYVSLDEAS